MLQKNTGMTLTNSDSRRHARSFYDSSLWFYLRQKDSFTAAFNENHSLHG
ncbi:hypothetical protein BLGI_721 [Brevibacillus laterosporus GI-9]|nr:hypothetical protein BLGI_721 [Brevibacillus laterosporus GI-9]